MPMMIVQRFGEGIGVEADFQLETAAPLDGRLTQDAPGRDPTQGRRGQRQQGRFPKERRSVTLRATTSPMLTDGCQGFQLPASALFVFRLDPAPW
jgi:hypothetical protein